MTRVAAAGADRRMVHRIGREARRGIDVAIAALDAGHQNVRWRRQTSRCCAVMAVRAIRVGCRMGVEAASPARETCGCAGMTSDAITTGSRDMARIGGRAKGTFGSLGCIGPTMASVAAAGAHRGMVHRIGREARRRIDVAIAALDPGNGHVGRRRQTGRRCAVMAARAIGVGRRVGIFAAGPAAEIRGSSRVTGDAVPARCRHVVGKGGRSLSADCPL